MLIKVSYVVLAYLCGSIPFAYIVAKLVGKIDIRTVASGNPGATNVVRALGKKAGFATFLGDSLKGFIPVYFASYIDSHSFYILAVVAAVLLGHMFTVFLKFRGGKGIATGMGAFLVLMPPVALIAIAVFILVFLCSGYISLGSMSMVLTLSLASYLLGYPSEYVIFTFAMALLIIYEHRSNIRRLRQGCENRFVIFKKKQH